MQRCVAAPKSRDGDLLGLAAHLAAHALARRGRRRGAVLVFLPGLQAIRKVEKFLRELRPEAEITILHSEVLGNEEEEDENTLPSNDVEEKAILSTAIGARSITSEDVKYVLIHPAMRSEGVNASGLKRLMDQRLSVELQGNMSGRVARTEPGLATFLFDVDDSELGLAHVEQNYNLIRPPAMNQIRPPAMMTLVLGPPSRLYLVLATVAHLRK